MKLIRSLAITLALILCVASTGAAGPPGPTATEEWVPEMLRLRLDNPRIEQGTKVTGMLQIVSGGKNGYHENEIEFSGHRCEYAWDCDDPTPPDVVAYSVLEVIIHVDANEQYAEIKVWLWVFGETLTGEQKAIRTIDWGDRHHRFVWRCERIDGNTLKILVWDYDDETLLINKTLTIEHPAGTGYLTLLDHAHEYWRNCWDAIAVVEFHEIYDETEGWMSIGEAGFDEIKWVEESPDAPVEHMEASFEWIREHECTAPKTGTTLAYQRRPMETMARESYDEFCYLAHVLNGATGKGWSHALFWYEGYPP